MTHILVIEAHPDEGRFTSALADAYATGALAAGATLSRLALRDLRFDPILRGGFGGGQALEPDLAAARAAIEAAQHLVWVFPVWWGSLPALLKGFIDRAFLPGWAFEQTGAPLPKGLLAGRTSRVISSMDSPWWWYRLAHGRAAHRTLVGATLNYVGVTRVSETTVYRLRNLGTRARADCLERARAAGSSDASRRASHGLG